MMDKDLPNILPRSYVIISFQISPKTTKVIFGLVLEVDYFSIVQSNLVATQVQRNFQRNRFAGLQKIGQGIFG